MKMNENLFSLINPKRCVFTYFVNIGDHDEISQIIGHYSITINLTTDRL